MKALDDLQEKLVAQAIKGINTDAVVKRLTKKLEQNILDGFEGTINEMDISYWVRNELEDESTKAGKAFSKSLSVMAEKMAKSLES